MTGVVKKGGTHEDVSWRHLTRPEAPPWALPISFGEDFFLTGSFRSQSQDVRGTVGSARASQLCFRS